MGLISLKNITTSVLLNQISKSLKSLEKKVLDLFSKIG
jgi:hypothetical protein